MNYSYPRYSNLTESQKYLVNNGCGPSWFPKKLKQVVSIFFFGWCFEASCGRHDWGYLIGGDWKRRLVCDWKLFLAFMRDCIKLLFSWKFFLTPYAFSMSLIFILLVLICGAFSFRFGNPWTKQQALQYLALKHLAYNERLS